MGYTAPMKTLPLWALLLTGVACTAPPEPRDAIAAAANPVELGTVRWHRDLAVADEQARRRGAPILLLFQEVPG